MSASRMSRIRGRSTDSRSSTSRCASAASVTAWTCSIRVRARRSASKSRACSIATAARSAASWSSSTSALDERPRRQRADVEDADHVACDEQRHAEHRLDPLLAQDRVEHVGVVDVVEDHRLSSRPRRGRRSRRRRGSGRRPRPPPRSRRPRARRARSSPRRAAARRTCRAPRICRIRGSSTESSSSTSRCASAASVTACTCSIRSRALCSASKRRAWSIAIAARSAASCNSSTSAGVNSLGVSDPTWSDAEHLSRHEQRDAEHRLDPFPAQDRVEHVRVVDVVDDHGLLQGGDATGEPASDRDAHADLDLLLDPDGRATRPARSCPGRAAAPRRCRPRAARGSARGARRGDRRDEGARARRRSAPGVAAAAPSVAKARSCTATL